MVDAPLGENTSAGQADELPVHVSAVSHLSSRDGRHTCVVGANVHRSVQHGLLAGSHTAPARNLQVLGSQQELDPRIPGSQSSPGSTMPLPHIRREIV